MSKFFYHSTYFSTHSSDWIQGIFNSANTQIIKKSIPFLIPICVNIFYKFFFFKYFMGFSFSLILFYIIVSNKQKNICTCSKFLFESLSKWENIKVSYLMKNKDDYSDVGWDVCMRNCWAIWWNFLGWMVGMERTHCILNFWMNEDEVFEECEELDGDFLQETLESTLFTFK